MFGIYTFEVFKLPPFFNIFQIGVGADYSAPVAATSQRTAPAVLINPNSNSTLTGVLIRPEYQRSLTGIMVDLLGKVCSLPGTLPNLPHYCPPIRNNQAC